MTSERDRSRFIMQLKEQTAGDTQSLADVDQIGAAVGLSSEQSRAVARHLAERGWIRFLQTTSGGRAQITVDGVEAVERLATPKWKRYVTDPKIVIPIALTLITLAVTRLADALLHWLF